MSWRRITDFIIHVKTQRNITNIPGGPYSGFAGRDASRGLATFSVEPVSDDYDDLSDLKPSEMEQVQEWELQFSEKYDLVGKLLKPGEESR